MSSRTLLLGSAALLGACQPSPRAAGPDFTVPIVSSVPVHVESSSDAGVASPSAPAAPDAGVALEPCHGRPAVELAPALRAIAGSMRACYERALRVDRNLAGRFRVLLRVGVNGRVEAFSTLVDELGSPALADCIEQKFRAPTYPASLEGCAEAVVPLNFTPKSDDAAGPDAG